MPRYEWSQQQLAAFAAREKDGRAPTTAVAASIASEAARRAERLERALGLLLPHERDALEKILRSHARLVALVTRCARQNNLTQLQRDARALLAEIDG